MAEITKPLDINKIWASAGDVLAPSDSKIATGWQVEIPPRQYFNYIDQKQDQAIAHINQHGIPVWDNTTEYQYSVSGTKSICMGSDGTVYRAKQVSINQNPVTDLSDTYWEIAFANVSDFYTQTQSDARYLQKSANLSDLTNTATARTNLSVYSQAQTYTKTEVDAKTTVSSTAQAQAQASDTVLITPLKLFQAFKGVNQSLTTNGYQDIAGLRIQWIGVIPSITSGSSVAFTWPKPFSATPFACAIATDFTTGTSLMTSYSVTSKTTTGANLACNYYSGAAGSTSAVTIIVVGPV